MSDRALLSCQHVVLVYPDGTRALDGVDLEIGAGERIALTGANGAGKTSLVRTWNGLLRPTDGSVSIDGRPIAGRHVAELARSVGITFQDPSAQLFASTCRREVEFGARNIGARGRELGQAVEASLDAVGLLGRAGTNPYDLGPSKRRLLAIATVLAMRPRLIVLDEPTIGLDDEEVVLVASNVREQAGQGRAVVSITHDRRLLGSGAFDRELRMAAGRIVEAQGPARD